jgi:hypothetical protein
VSDRRRLADAVPNADGHGAGDNWIQPSLFDTDGEGAEPSGNEESKRDRGPRVGRPLVILTRGELESKRQRCLDHLGVAEHLGLDKARILEDLADVLFLLGEE